MTDEYIHWKRQKGRFNQTKLNPRQISLDSKKEKKLNQALSILFTAVSKLDKQTKELSKIRYTRNYF